MFNRQKKKALFSKHDLQSFYVRIVTHCLNEKFYTDMGVPDTLPHRYGIVVMHLFLIMDRIGMDRPSAQMLFDIFFHDMDRSMRENGVGDLAVPKRIKKMMKVFYEDIALYQEAYTTSQQIAKTISKTLYHGTQVDKKVIQLMTTYITKNKETLDEASLEALTNAFNFKF